MVTMAEAGRSWILSPRALEHATLTTDVTGQDFVGLLIGDVSANWAAGQPTPAGTPVQVQLSSPDIARGHSNIFAVSLVGQRNDVFSANLTIAYDPAVLSIAPDAVRAAGDRQGLLVAARSAGPGLLSVALASGTPLPLEAALVVIKAEALATTSGSPITVTAASLNEGAVPVSLGTATAATLTPLDESGEVQLGKGRDGTVYANGTPLRIRGAEAKERVFEQFSITSAEKINGEFVAEVERDGGRKYRWKLTDDLEFAGIDTIANVVNADLPRHARGEAFRLPPRTPLETEGAITLSRDVEGFLYAGDRPIMAATGHFNADRLTGYEVLAAEAVDGQNRLLLNSDGGLFQQAYDAAWRFTGLVHLPTQISQFSPEQIGQLETAFGVDVDGSGQIGIPPTIPGTIIEDKGLVTLSQQGEYVLFANGQQILPDYASTMEYPPRWQAIAAEIIDEGNRLLYRSSDGMLIYELHVSDDWSEIVASGDPISINPVEPGWQDEIWAIEVGYEVDLDRDGRIGPPLT
jgi:hypothetical protein